MDSRKTYIRQHSDVFDLAARVRNWSCHELTILERVEVLLWQSMLTLQFEKTKMVFINTDDRGKN